MQRDMPGNASTSNCRAQMAGLSADDDTQVDAEMEDAPFSQHRSDKGTESQRKVNNDRCKRISAVDEYKAYLDIINRDIPDDIDILIISEEDDIDHARQFKDYIQRHVRFNIHGTTMAPRVEILDDIPGFSPTIIDRASDRALFIFLFITAGFCSKDLSLLRGHACLLKSLEDKSKRNTVFTVHTSPKEGRPYTIPYLMNGLQSLNYSLVGFVDKVVKLLESESNTIARKMMNLNKRKKIYFAENHVRIKKQKAFMQSHLAPLESSAKSESLAFQEPQRHVTADQVSSLGCTLKDLRLTTPATGTEGPQLLQSNENPVPQNFSHTNQRSLLKEQSLMPETKGQRRVGWKESENDFCLSDDVQVDCMEGLSPTSLRQSADGGEHTSSDEDDEQHQTVPKQLA